MENMERFQKTSAHKKLVEAIYNRRGSWSSSAPVCTTTWCTPPPVSNECRAQQTLPFGLYFLRA